MLQKYKNNLATYYEIVNQNREEIDKDNKDVLEVLAFGGVLIFSALFFVTLLVEPERLLFILFAVAGIISYYMFKKINSVARIKNIVYVQYFLLVLMFVVSIYVGVITNTHNYAVVLGVFFAVAPMIFISNPRTTLLFFVICYSISMPMVVWYKKDIDLAVNDVINCTVFFILGIIVATAVSSARLTVIQSNGELRLRENIDFLTKLPNRRRLFNQFKTSEKIHGILMVDVDNFKAYNDTYGHQKGDEALRALAICLTAASGEKLEFLRYGGEEFIGIYYDDSPDDLMEISRKLNESVGDMNITHSASKHGYMTVSIGAYFSKEPIREEKTIHYADIALYKAKASGKNTTTLYNESMENLSPQIQSTCRGV